MAAYATASEPYYAQAQASLQPSEVPQCNLLCPTPSAAQFCAGPVKQYCLLEWFIATTAQFVPCAAADTCWQASHLHV